MSVKYALPDPSTGVENQSKVLASGYLLGQSEHRCDGGAVFPGQFPHVFIVSFGDHEDVRRSHWGDVVECDRQLVSGYESCWNLAMHNLAEETICVHLYSFEFLASEYHFRFCKINAVAMAPAFLDRKTCGPRCTT